MFGKKIEQVIHDSNSQVERLRESIALKAMREKHLESKIESLEKEIAQYKAEKNIQILHEYLDGIVDEKVKEKLDVLTPSKEMIEIYPTGDGCLTFRFVEDKK